MALIYSFGLFDYLNYKISRLILNCSLHGHLHRHFMEYGVEWYLMYRDQAELLALTAGIPMAQQVDIAEIEHGIIKFLEIHC